MKNNAVQISKIDFIRTSYVERASHVPPRDFCSLTYRISGEVEIIKNETRIISKAGFLTFVPALCEYDTVVRKCGEMLVLHFALSEDGEAIVDKPMAVAMRNSEAVIQLYERGIRHLRNGATLDCIADAYRLLSIAECELLSARHIPYRKMIELKKYIDDNLCDSGMRVGELSELFGTSEVYFRREFKKFYGMSPIEYIKSQRLELAAQLLNIGRYSVTETAMRSGFDSVSYFSSEFSRYFGMTPREYQRL